MELLTVHDCDEICDWMRRMPLLVHDQQLGYVMTHAGIPHIWDLEQAQAHAHEVEQVIQGEEHREYFAGMYGDQPACWDDGLKGLDRWRLITNYFTRMRLVNEEGCLNLGYKGELAGAPEGWIPWYELREENPLPAKILFGHWAALEGKTGRPNSVALDTGCVWGGALTAVCLESGESISIPGK